MPERTKISDFKGGINQWKGPTDLDKNESLENRNQQYFSPGILEKRKGYHRLDCNAGSEIKGIQQFCFRDKYYYLVVSEDSIYSLDLENETLTEIKTDLSNYPWSFGKLNDCALLLGNGIDRPQLYDTSIRDCGVFDYPKFTASILGGDGGDSKFRVKVSWYDEANDYESEISNQSNEASGTSGKPTLSVDLSKISTPASRFTHYRVYRTLTDGNTYYFALQVAIADTSVTFDLTDAELGRSTEPHSSMPIKPFVCSGIGRIWCGGNVSYSTGTVNVLNGSSNVKGVDTGWDDSMIGKFLVVAGKYKYVIQGVAAQKIRIKPPYRGATAAGADYKIISDEWKINYCDKEPLGLPRIEDWNHSLGIHYAGNDKMKGILGSHKLVAVFGEDNIYLITEANGEFIAKAGEGCKAGTSSGRSIATDGKGTFFYVSSHNLGIWSYNQSNIREDKNINIGLKVIRKLRALTRSDFENAIGIYYDGKYKVWIGEKCFVYDTRMGSCSEEESFIPTALCTANIDNDKKSLIGDEEGYLYKSDTGTNDGSNLLTSAQRKGTATAGTSTTLSDSTKSWPVNVCQGLYVNIISGTGEGERQKIISNTAKKLTVSGWTASPDGTSVYAIGAIRFWRRPGWRTLIDVMRYWRLYVHQIAQSSGSLSIKVFKDYETTPEIEKTLDMTETIGHIGIPERADALTFDIKQEDVDVEIEIYALLLEFAPITQGTQPRGRTQPSLEREEY